MNESFNFLLQLVQFQSFILCRWMWWKCLLRERRDEAWMNEMRYGDWWRVPFSHITLALQFIIVVDSAFILSTVCLDGQLNWMGHLNGIIYIISFFTLWEQDLKKCILQDQFKDQYLDILYLVYVSRYFFPESILKVSVSRFFF